MAKITCAFSGLEINVQYFPMSIKGNHPIFDAESKELDIHYLRYLNGELTNKTDQYLLFLAILKDTGLVDFKTNCLYTEQTHSIVTQYMSALYLLSSRVKDTRKPTEYFPGFSISEETNKLGNIKYWIKDWEEAYTVYLNKLEDKDLMFARSIRDDKLSKMIRSPDVPEEKRAKLLSEWAADAACFDETSYAAEWKDIIVKCYNNEDIFTIHIADLEELIDHCESYLDIEQNTRFSHELMRVLRKGLDNYNSLTSIGIENVLDSENPGFIILDPEQNKDDAIVALMISTAPKEKPSLLNYPRKADYNAALACWNEAQKQYTVKGN